MLSPNFFIAFIFFDKRVIFFFKTKEFYHKFYHFLIAFSNYFIRKPTNDTIFGDKLKNYETQFFKI